MRHGLRKLAFVLAPPLLSAGLLAGIVAEQRTHVKPQDVEPYYVRTRVAINSIPYIMGAWTGTDHAVPQAAQKLLRPNAILSRTYSDNSAAASGNDRRSAALLIVQCRDSNDMLGHYPPVCYRAQGMTPEPRYTKPRDWQIGGLNIQGYEYHFTEVWMGMTNHTTVYNFFVIPNKGFVRDMKGVEEAAEDYQQRHFGAAQFQVVFHGLASAERSRDERDEMFATLIGPNVKVINDLLTTGALK
jgi:hypothetical protein